MYASIGIAWSKDFANWEWPIVQLSSISTDMSFALVGGICCGEYN